jgi:hypothetical protein
MPGPDGVLNEVRSLSRSHQMISGDDPAIAFLLLHVLRIVATKPRETWPREAMQFSRDLHALVPAVLASFHRDIPESLPALSGRSKHEVNVNLFAAYVLEKMEVVAAASGHPQPWNLVLKGGSRVQEALDQGRGAIVWCETCMSASLLTKAAFASAAFDLHHLSRPGHNLSISRFGMRFLNPIVRRAEDRFLAERIIVDYGNELPVARHIMALLQENKVVSLTISSAGSQVVEAPALNGVARIATGALGFAMRTGAPLFPVFSHREDDAYVVAAGDPIELAGMKRDQAYEFAVQEYARRLDAFARAHPLDWYGWRADTYHEG